jgi:antitoxin HicB
VGLSIDDFLKEEGIFEEAQAQAVKEVVAWRLDEATRKVTAFLKLAVSLS